MFSIFKKQKRIKCEEHDEDIDDPGISTTSNSLVPCVGPTNQDSLENLNNVDTTLDLGNKDSGPQRPILTVRFILFIYYVIIFLIQYLHVLFNFH